jgi:hypothetical protein
MAELKSTGDLTFANQVGLGFVGFGIWLGLRVKGKRVRVSVVGLMLRSGLRLRCRVKG